MKVLVVGLGTQGKKRIKFISKNFVGSVDPKSSDATFSHITDAPVNSYDAVFLCVPDSEKIELIKYCILHKKHILVEKPLITKKPLGLKYLQNEANLANILIYTAYNHRFEPHIKTVKEILDKYEIGRIFSIKMVYGNGTAQLVKASEWRDHGMGVISDLSPHLLDTLAYWIGIKKIKDLFLFSHNFETSAPDHAVVHFNMDNIAVELEMSLCMWRNTFNCDIFGEKGSIHISSLCKWGPSILTIRKRVLPSGIPNEKISELEIQDPTWGLEHEHFFNQIKNKHETDFTTDAWIANLLGEMESML